jgi:hypothetical protein
MNIKKIVKLALLLVLLFVFFHPITAFILLVKFGGILFALPVIAIGVKILLGKSILDLFKDPD